MTAPPSRTACSTRSPTSSDRSTERAPVLAGAAVEGPNAAATRGLVSGMRTCPANGVDVYAPFNNAAEFKDDVQSYSNTEPAVDLTITSPLAFAWQMSGA